MRRAWKVALVVLAIPLVGVAGLVAWANLRALPDYSSMPLPEIKASTDPAIIAQGEYVVNAIAHCSACHGPGETTNKHELGPRGDLRGGYVMHAGPFGTFYPANLTPDPETGIGKLSDGQLARVIHHGVDRNGGFAPLMSFAVGTMSQEDLVATVSYLRSLPPVKNPTLKDEWGIVAKLLAGNFKPRTAPHLKHVAAGGVSVERGEYIANGPGLCVGCHTPHDMAAGFVEKGPHFSGEPHADPDFEDPNYEIAAPNLTPSPEGGHITAWDEEAFVSRFKAGMVQRGTKMPWDNFKQMTDDDLRSIYRYLRTVPPVTTQPYPTRRLKGWKPPTKA